MTKFWDKVLYETIWWFPKSEKTDIFSSSYEFASLMLFPDTP